MDDADVSKNKTAGTRKPGSFTKIKEPDTIKIDTMKPFNEIMILAFVAAKEIKSSCAL